MSVFVIADTHLSFGVDKPMDIFGKRWENYQQKLKDGWESVVSPSDTVIIPGDISWAMTLQEALPDFEFLNALPGEKILLKGNHDYWWQTQNKLNAFVADHGFNTVRFLYNNAHLAEDFIMCGSRGWYPDDREPKSLRDVDHEKIVAREVMRLRRSLEEGKRIASTQGTKKELVAFLHFPPYFTDYCCEELVEELVSAGVKRCYFGHIHGNYSAPARLLYRGISFELVSGDYLGFIPHKIVFEE